MAVSDGVVNFSGDIILLFDSYVPGMGSVSQILAMLLVLNLLNHQRLLLKNFEMGLMNRMKIMRFANDLIENITAI